MITDIEPPIPPDSETPQAETSLAALLGTEHDGAREFLKELDMTRLVIVWRNPRPQSRPHRWQTLERGLGRTLYIIQQLMLNGKQECWTTTASLEVLRGGRVV